MLGIARSARRSLEKVKKKKAGGFFGNGGGEEDEFANVWRTPVHSMQVPAELINLGDEEKMDASVFLATWDMKGRGLSQLKQAKELLPAGFDIYVVGVQNCKSLTELKTECLSMLGSAYMEFSHLMSVSAGVKSKASIGMMVLVRRALVDSGEMSMYCVDTVKERRQSAMPLMRDASDLMLSRPGGGSGAKGKSGKSGTELAGKAGSGGAVLMRFKFYDVNVLFANMKEARIRELTDLMADLEVEKSTHVLLMGDFGDDVKVHNLELRRRLELEGFDDVPPRFKDVRSLIITRSQDAGVQKNLISGSHGHYDVAVSGKMPPAPFATLRLHGGADLDGQKLPGPPRQRRATSVDWANIPPPHIETLARSKKSEVDWANIPPPHIETLVRGKNPEVDVHEMEGYMHEVQNEVDEEKQEVRRRALEVAEQAAREKAARAALAAPPKNTIEDADAEDADEGAQMLHRAIESIRTGLADGAKGLVGTPSYGFCAVCADEIVSFREYFKSLGKVYHKDCMTCSDSDCGKLITSQFYMVEGKMVCEDSYKKLFVQTCAGCELEADPQDHLVNMQGSVFHVDCFTCSKQGCGAHLAHLSDDATQLLPTEFTVGAEGQLFCADHSARPKCHTCGERAGNDDAVQVCVGEPDEVVVMHKACFRCEECDESIADLDGQYVIHEGRTLCQRDYERLMHLTCAVCDKNLPQKAPIVYALENKFHPACWKCAQCDATDDTLDFAKTGAGLLLCSACTSCTP